MLEFQKVKENEMTLKQKTQWTLEDSDRATKEGWAIAECEGSADGPVQLQAWHEAGIFEHDPEAWIHVRIEAEKNSELHIRALKYIGENNPEEFRRIMNYKKE